MGPDLEKSKMGNEVLGSKENGSVSQVKCISSYEDNSFHEEVVINDVQDNRISEDMEINITECTKSGDNGQVETRCEDATESMSSFGDTLSDTDNCPVLGDAEVESQLCVGDAAASVFDRYGGAFQMRRKKLTDHWRRFIRPLMWRCKWIELQIKEFQSQALKYDRELAEHEQRKLFVREGFDTRSLPFSSCTQRKKVMKRKKRKRVEETTDITSYMLQHNLFSYYENKKSAANGASMDNDSSNLDKAIKANDEFGLQDGWASLDSRGIDNINENILWKIEVLQLQVRKLRARIENVVRKNPGKFSSVNRLSIPASGDVLTGSDQNPASPPKYGDSMPVKSLYTVSHHLPESAISSHGEVTPHPDMIESTDQPLVGLLCENNAEGILIHNQAVKEEMQDEKIFRSQLTEKLMVLTEEQKVQTSEANPPAGTSVAHVNFGGKTLPKSRSNVSNNKRKPRRRKSGRGGWNRKS